MTTYYAIEFMIKERSIKTYENAWKIIMDAYDTNKIDGYELEGLAELAERYLGYEYNHSFYPDNGKFYCSQYIAEILPVFDIIPMKFGDGENEISDYWMMYYEELGMPVPVGQPGTNPGQLSISKI